MAGLQVCCAPVSVQHENARALVWEVVRQFSTRLERTPFGRFARAFALLLSVVFVSLLLADRLEYGAKYKAATWVTSAARTSLWCVVGAVTLAASQKRALADRRDGVEWLCLSVGLAPSRLPWLRMMSTFWLGFRWASLSVLLVGGAAMAAAGSFSVVWKRSLVMLACLIFLAVTTALFSAMATLADELAPKRGRSALMLLVFISVALAELSSVKELSVAHWVSALLPMLTKLMGVRASV
jgi:hypothetical protein